MDAEHVIAKSPDDRLPGLELIVDNCHPGPMAGFLMARELTRVIGSGFGVPETDRELLKLSSGLGAHTPETFLASIDDLSEPGAAMKSDRRRTTMYKILIAPADSVTILRS